MTLIDKSAEWHAARATGIGSSDAAAAAGLSPWTTPYQLWDDKVNGVRGAITNAENVEWGTRLESVVLQWYADTTGYDVVAAPVMYRHPEHAFMIANLDGEVPNDRLVEVKTVDKDTFRFSDEWGKPGSDNVPLHYMLQVQHGLAVRGYDKADLVALVGGNAPKIYPIARDEALIATLIELEAAFWGHVERKEPPPAASVEEARQRWPQSVVREVGATAEVAEACERLRLLKAEEKALGSEIDTVQPSILAYLGDADTLTYGGATLATWKSSKASLKLDVAALEADHPEIIAAYTREVPGSRRFLLKAPK